jgi:hypothetical protein
MSDDIDLPLPGSVSYLRSPSIADSLLFYMQPSSLVEYLAIEDLDVGKISWNPSRGYSAYVRGA